MTAIAPVPDAGPDVEWLPIWIGLESRPAEIALWADTAPVIVAACWTLPTLVAGPDVAEPVAWVEPFPVPVPVAGREYPTPEEVRTTVIAPDAVAL
jgi:squalene cyclase